jgi:membrane-associated phospholipid phosphatase
MEISFASGTFGQGNLRADCRPALHRWALYRRAHSCVPLQMLVLLMLVVAPALRAQPGEDLRDAAWVTGKMITAPLHGSARDYIGATFFVSGILVSSIFDDDLHKEVLKPHGSTVDVLGKIGRAYQGPFVIFGTAAAFYGYGLYEENDHARRIGMEIVESFAIAGAGTQVVKHIVGRARPFQGLGNSYFKGPTLKNSFQSFPSGDVTVATAFASVLAAEARSIPVTAVVYGLAGLTAFQRMNRNQHWLSDVAAGATWGTAVGLGVVHYNRLRTASKVTPSLGIGPGGVGLTWNF